VNNTATKNGSIMK